MLTIQPSQRPGRFFVMENGFRFEFPTFIANALKKFLENGQFNPAITTIGEWLMSLPFEERMTVNIQWTADRMKIK